VFEQTHIDPSMQTLLYLSLERDTMIVMYSRSSEQHCRHAPMASQDGGMACFVLSIEHISCFLLNCIFPNCPNRDRHGHSYMQDVISLSFLNHKAFQPKIDPGSKIDFMLSTGTVICGHFEESLSALLSTMGNTIDDAGQKCRGNSPD
jgi:hypothetical protein